MSSEQLVRNCAPTLAGIKTGSLYTITFRDPRALRDDLIRLNKTLGRKGIRIIPLKMYKDHALIYLYRPEMLAGDLEDPLAAKMLRSLGYSCDSVAGNVAELALRIRSGKSFPHEIGLFLGYPPSDVQGFIRSPNEGYLMTGYWKVYSNEKEARATFLRFRRCTEEYGRMLRSGRTLEQLAV
ncbi:MAG: DUF3793 family protein [Clostridiales bacterium]|nr:DUF3793 family protein [Clostridiales bacterium]